MTTIQPFEVEVAAADGAGNRIDVASRGQSSTATACRAASIRII